MQVNEDKGAALRNVSTFMGAVSRVMNRAEHLPGLATFYGPSGYGKSFAAAHAASLHAAPYVEAKSSWTKKALLGAILKVLGVIDPAKTLYEMTAQVSQQLVSSKRPLIIDEVDHIVDRGAIEIIRDIYEGSRASIILIGEEMLPAKLKKWERMHGRMLEWIPAQPADLEDARKLCRLYVEKVTIADDLLRKVSEVSHGSIRRICVNLDRIREVAVTEALDTVTLSQWGDRPLFTGDAPKRRL